MDVVLSSISIIVLILKNIALPAACVTTGFVWVFGGRIFFHRCGGREELKENGVDINLSLTLDHTEGWNAWRIPPMGRLRQNTHCAGGSRMV